MSKRTNKSTSNQHLGVKKMKVESSTKIINKQLSPSCPGKKPSTRCRISRCKGEKKKLCPSCVQSNCGNCRSCKLKSKEACISYRESKFAGSTAGPTAFINVASDLGASRTSSSLTGGTVSPIASISSISLSVATEVTSPQLNLLTMSSESNTDCTQTTPSQFEPISTSAISIQVSPQSSPTCLTKVAGSAVVTAQKMPLNSNGILKSSTSKPVTTQNTLSKWINTTKQKTIVGTQPSANSKSVLQSADFLENKNYTSTDTMVPMAGAGTDFSSPSHSSSSVEMQPSIFTSDKGAITSGGCQGNTEVKSKSEVQQNSNTGIANISEVQQKLQQILSSLSKTLRETLSSVDDLSLQLQNIHQPSSSVPVTKLSCTSTSTGSTILAGIEPLVTAANMSTSMHRQEVHTSHMDSCQTSRILTPVTGTPVCPDLSNNITLSSAATISATEKISLKSIIQEAISNIRIDLHITKCGISGPPGTGKTHFRRLLLGKKRPSKRKSTPLSTRADELTPGDIAIAPTSPQQTNTLKWTVLDEDPWLRLLTNTVFEYLKNSNIEELNDEGEDSAGDHSDFGSKVYLSVLKTLRDTKGKRKMKRRTLHKINLIYLADTGGQPQFQEILPHFVQSSVHFLIHNLSQKLSDCPEFQYTVNEVEYKVPETLKASNISIIEQSVRSACSCIPKDSWNKGRPQLAIIGTFKDQCFPAEINRILQDKSKEIKTTLTPYMECKSTMKCNMIEYSKDCAIYPIDASEKGWDTNGPILEKIRSEINEFGKTINLKKIPMSYFIFLQTLKHVSKKRPYISISECKKIASEGFIALSDEEIKEALHLFNDVNLILHFPETSEAKDIIFLDPTFLYDKITKLIVKSFDCLQSPLAQTTEFHCTGVFKKDAFTICDHPFTIDMFLSILKDLYIISETEHESYFMPCVLQLEDPTSLSSNCCQQLEPVKMYMNIKSIGGPLLISFGDRISPRGLFCAIVVILSKHFGWKLNSDDNSIRRRNIIEFRVMHSTDNSIRLPLPACVGTAVIFDKTTHLEVYTTCSETYCSEVRCAIVWSLSEACKTLKYQIGDLGVEQGFRCELCPGRGQHHTIVSKNTKKLLVHKCSKNSRQHGVLLSLPQRIWFQGHTQDSSITEVVIPDISVIAKILLPKTNEWYKIGLILHLHINDLEKIRIDNQNEEERFLKVLDKWKKNKDPSFTWNTIRDVLKSDLVKENVLAQEIEDTYLNNS